MNYLQSILWVILAALCVVQSVAKLPPEAPKYTALKLNDYKLDAPFPVKAGQRYEVDFNPITTEIKINGVIVRKGN